LFVNATAEQLQLVTSVLHQLERSVLSARADATRKMNANQGEGEAGKAQGQTEPEAAAGGSKRIIK
jgi:hypothetical protein